MSKKSPLETSGDHETQIWKSLGPCSYGPQMGAPGPQIKLFFVNFSIFLFLKVGPIPKNSGPNPRSFCFWRGGGTLGLSQTSAPSPLGQILATCLIGPNVSYSNKTKMSLLLVVRDNKLHMKMTTSGSFHDHQRALDSMYSWPQVLT